MMKFLNIKNIVIFAAVLAVLHFGISLVASPMVSPIVVKAVNEAAGTKISIGKVNVWPLTLSISLKDLKVFDPQKEDERILSINNASIRLGALGLLSKRLTVSSININGAQLSLVGEPDGSFNVQKLGTKETAGKAKPKAGILDMLKGKKDWFSKVYDFLKDRFSKKSLEKKREAASRAKKITRDVLTLPKGRVVHFKTAAGRYLLEVRNLAINNFSLKLEARDGREIEIDKAELRAGNLGFDPELGLRLGSISLSGGVMNKGAASGRMDLRYSAISTARQEKVEIDLNLKDVDLDAVRFIYEDSLPVEVVKGRLDLTSKTDIDNEALNSKNTFSLSEHELKAKGSLGLPSTGFMSALVICEGLNSLDSATLKFDITGTVDKPEFSGFMKSLKDLIKPSLKTIAPSAQTGITDAVGSLQSIFGTKK